MGRILDSGVDFTAVMCSNDQSAVGAMRALREAGRRIPVEVAVTGFDDQLESLAQNPPLTSVHYPLFETGYRALLLLRQRIEAGARALPDAVRVSTWLVTRQSCGCLPGTVVLAARHNASLYSLPTDTPQQIREELVQALQEAVLAEPSPSTVPELHGLCEQLADGFLRTLADGDVSHFQISLIEVIQRVENLQGDTHSWQAAISILRQGARVLAGEMPPVRTKVHIDDPLQQARILLNESVQRRYMRLQRTLSTQAEMMGRMTAKLLAAGSERDIHQALLEDLPALGIRSGYVCFFEPEGDDRVACSRMLSPDEETPDIRFETRSFPPPGLYAGEQPFSLTLLPIYLQSACSGYVVFEGGPLDPLAKIIQQLEAAIRSEQLHNQVLELSLTDALTGIHNRRYFDLMLEKETDRSQRYHRDLAVIMADIDHFKLYNDTHGHPAGDRALQEVAQCISRGVRRGLDMVSRYGGEEFAIILPETDMQNARIVAETIRTELKASGLFLQPTTVSLGISSLEGKRWSSDDLVEATDRALYQAKQQGRDRAVAYEDWMDNSLHGPGVVPPMNPG
jgi:diguanylate cyclase (GGDEF)-like protein